MAFKKFVFGTAVGLISLVATTANASYNLTLCGASPGGLWSLLGAGVDAAVKASHPGSVVTYQTSGGGFANVALLQQGKCDLALIHDAEAVLARDGKAPFKSPVNNLQTVAVMYTWAPMQMIINREVANKYGIKSISDIAAKKVPVRVLLNKRGNVASQVGASMLKAAGASEENIKSWGGDVVYAASKEQGELMRDRRADIILNSLFVNHRSIRQLAEALEVNLLEIDNSTTTKVTSEWSIGTYEIKNAAYSWSSSDVITPTLSAQLFVRADADPKMVSDVARALVKNVDLVRGVHKAMKPLDVKLMSSSKSIAYHPQAAAAYN
jgi:TRAP transporter TAXI family solute receptor